METPTLSLFLNNQLKNRGICTSSIEFAQLKNCDEAMRVVREALELIDGLNARLSAARQSLTQAQSRQAIKKRQLDYSKLGLRALEREMRLARYNYSATAYGREARKEASATLKAKARQKVVENAALASRCGTELKSVKDQLQPLPQVTSRSGMFSKPGAFSAVCDSVRPGPVPPGEDVYFETSFARQVEIESLVSAGYQVVSKEFPELTGQQQFLTIYDLQSLFQRVLKVMERSFVRSSTGISAKVYDDLDEICARYQAQYEQKLGHLEQLNSRPASFAAGAGAGSPPRRPEQLNDRPVSFAAGPDSSSPRPKSCQELSLVLVDASKTTVTSSKPAQST